MFLLAMFVQQFETGYSLSNVAIVAKKTYARDVNGQPARCRLYLLNKLQLTYFL